MIHKNGDISIRWTLGDVRTISPGITDADARRILDRVHWGHSSAVGISWDTLREALRSAGHAEVYPCESCGDPSVAVDDDGTPLCESCSEGRDA